jgi:hypothetical protein
MSELAICRKSVLGSNGAENRSKKPSSFLTVKLHDPRSSPDFIWDPEYYETAALKKLGQFRLTSRNGKNAELGIFPEMPSTIKCGARLTDVL